MAKKSAPKSEFVPFDYKSVVWCNVPMLDDDFEAFDANRPDDETVIHALFKLMEGGWKLTASQQDNGQSYRYSVVCLKADSPSVNIGTSAFASDPHEALQLIVWKLFFMADLDLSTYPVGGSRRARG